MAKPDIYHLKPVELVRLLNSTQEGAVIDDKMLRAHRNRAGFRIGDGQAINFFRYTAWLFDELHEPKKPIRTAKEIVRNQADIMRERRREGRDIGAIPPVKDPERRERCRLDLRMFFATYFPDIFFRPFSADHDRIINNTQTCILDRGRFADGVFRGFGKSVIGGGAVFWAALYAHKQLMPIICATESDAVDVIDWIKVELETNDLLLEDFPEVCHPYRMLEGIPHRCAGQLCGGRQTHIGYGRMELVFPCIEGSKASDVMICARGLTGRLRGMKHARQDGQIVRPDAVFIDDPQNDESAKSPSQCAYREKLITGAVLGLAGHAREMSAIMACTVIVKGDLADRFLDRTRHPGWQGVKMPLVHKWADRHEDLWLGEYAALFKQDVPDSRGGRAEALRQATEFYRARRAEMDAGADVAWKECFYEGEISAIQHAYNLRIDRGEAVFLAEYQMEPPDEFASSDEPQLEPKDILQKLSGLGRRVVPFGHTVLTAFIDPGSRKNTFWLVCSWGDKFGGSIIDAGQAEVEVGKHGIEAALTETVMHSVDSILGRPYPVEGGGERNPGIIFIDSGWESKVIYDICRARMRDHIFPSKGQGDELELRPPRRTLPVDRGNHWYHTLTNERDAILMMYNTDHWKTFAAERLRTPIGGNGCLTLWGKEKMEHRILADHLSSEASALKEKKNGEIFLKWAARPGRDNHFWDCLIGCCVAAARLGIRLDDGITIAPPPVRKSAPRRDVGNERRIRAHY